MIRILSAGDLVYHELPRGCYIPIHTFQKSLNFKHLERNSYLSVVTKKYELGPVNILIDKIEEKIIGRIILTDTAIILTTGIYNFSKFNIYDSTFPVNEDTNNNKSIKQLIKNLELLKKFLINFRIRNSIFLPFVNDSSFCYTENMNKSPIQEKTDRLPMFSSCQRENTNNTCEELPPPTKNQQQETAYRGLTSLEKTLRKRVIEVFDQIHKRKILKAVRLLRGVGIGFTPSGDDFIMGLVLAINLRIKLGISHQKNVLPSNLFARKYEELKKQIIKIAYYGNDFMDFHLKLISDYRVPLKIKLMLEWLMNGSKINLQKYISPLAKTGHSSGMDIICGFITGMEF